MLPAEDRVSTEHADLVWEEPIGDARGKPRKNWVSVAQQLRAAPGAWAVIDFDISVATAHAYRAGRNKAFPIGQFEFTVRGTDGNGRAEKLYARFVGGEVA